MKEYLKNKIIPRLQGDGGWMDIVSQEGNVLAVQLQGECSKCHVADRCMRWVETEIARDLNKEISIQYRRKKPFFWDNH